MARTVRVANDEVYYATNSFTRWPCEGTNAVVAMRKQGRYLVEHKLICSDN